MYSSLKNVFFAVNLFYYILLSVFFLCMCPLSGHSGDFFLVPDLPENLLNTPQTLLKQKPKYWAKIYIYLFFCCKVIEFTILFLTVFFKRKVSNGNNEKVTSAEGRGSLFEL
uniref:Uncharacterized protein n=1 Tax=Ixodes ricinus TaxID=34613 RepID=A0A147BF75_IXORI